MKVGVQRAAELTGKSRSTIQRAIKSGKLSAVEDETGKKVIDVEELEQVYGLIKREEKPSIPSSQAQKTSQAETPPGPRENQQAVERIKQLEEEVAKLKAERDYWHQQANQLSSKQHPGTAQKAEAGSRNPLSWLGWLFGRQKEKD